MDSDDTVSRRSVLRATGGAFAGASATGITASDLTAAAPDEVVEVNVGFESAAGRVAAREAASEVVREFDSLDAVTVRLPKRAASRLGNRADVRYVEENGRMHALAERIPWGVDRVGAPEQPADGSGADVAIVDSGIDSDYPDLQPNLGKGAAAVACSDLSNDCGVCRKRWDDDLGHGTRLAVLAAAANNGTGAVGVAPQATLHAVKVLGSDGSGTFSDVAAGIEYVADQGWDVANLSLGSSSGSSTVHDAVRYADDNGVNVVCAAGNGGPCTDCVTYPAAYPEAIAVSATNSNDDVARFSATGPEVELAAPGADIYFEACTGGGYGTLSGTSFAAAHVSGAAGILRAQGYSNDGARQRLADTADDLGLSSDAQGNGLLDVDGL